MPERGLAAITAPPLGMVGGYERLATAFA